MSAEEQAPPSVHLILMSRAPVPGKTKSRLSPPLSPEQARDFHVACLLDLIEAARVWRATRQEAGLETRLHLFITPAGSEGAFLEAGVTWPAEMSVHVQEGANLGERMERALELALAEPPRPAWALLVGTDLPLLGVTHFEEALNVLRRADIVFGPTIDGGYYLVGAKAPPAGLLQGPRWGTRTVLKDTLHAIRATGHQTGLISPLLDADTVDDLRAIRNHALTARTAHSRSLRFIEEWFQARTTQRA